MTLAAGTDLVEIHRIAAVLERHGDRFLQRVFTPEELAACEGRPDSLSARWAAKEAVAKALGTGIGEVAFREIEVVRDDCGCPSLRLHGAAATLSAERGLTQWAFVVAM
jgi:holo-[acyl-carrier protein] synthase